MVDLATHAKAWLYFPGSLCLHLHSSSMFLVFFLQVQSDMLDHIEAHSESSSAATAGANAVGCKCCSNASQHLVVRCNGAADTSKSLAKACWLPNHSWKHHLCYQAWLKIHLLAAPCSGIVLWTLFPFEAAQVIASSRPCGRPDICGRA